MRASALRLPIRAWIAWGLGPGPAVMKRRNSAGWSRGGGNCAVRTLLRRREPIDALLAKCTYLCGYRLRVLLGKSMYLRIPWSYVLLDPGVYLHIRRSHALMKRDVDDGAETENTSKTANDDSR